MLKLIDFVIQEPINDDDKKIGFKYPFNACDILCSENLAIIDKFFDEDLNVNENKNYESSKDEENYFENNEIKNKILESNPENNEILQINYSIGNEAIHMEADNNMTISGENLIIFNELIQNPEENKSHNNEGNKEEFSDNNQQNLNISQEKDEISINQQDTNNIKVHNSDINIGKNDNADVHLKSEENTYSQELNNEGDKKIPRYRVIDHLHFYLKF